MPLDDVTKGVCHRGRHTLDLPRLRLQTPTLRDLKMAIAAGSDPQAQRWLGFPARYLVPERQRNRMLAKHPGRGKPLCDTSALIAIDRVSGMFAGVIEVETDTGMCGGWLAPRFRSRGLGKELFTGGAYFVHHLLGIATVRAGAETTNAASIGALRSAGFVPMSGPDVHHLPDGRTVPSRWFRHDTDPPPKCPTFG